MLKKSYRIGPRSRVTQVVKKGRRLREGLIQARYIPNRCGFWRFSVVVSKKAGTSAVRRNLLRRRLYEAIRRNYEELRLERGTCYDVAVLLLSLPLKKLPSYSTLERNVITAIKKIHG